MSDLTDLAINKLAYRYLNHISYDSPETIIEVIEDLEQTLNQVGLGIAAGLIEVAAAIREHD